MIKHCSAMASKSLLKFVAKNKYGALQTYRVIDLPKDLVDNYVEFQMNCFAKNELANQIAGIPFSNKAMDEYKDIMKNKCANPLYHSIICYPEVDGKMLPEIIAALTVKYCKKHEQLDDYQAKTEEVKKLYQIIRYWNTVYPYSDVMEKYGIENAFEFQSVAVHPDYQNRGIATKILFNRYELCEKLNVGLLFAWATTEYTKRANEKNGWTSDYKISTDEILKKINVTFRSPTPFFYYMSYKL